MAADLMSFAGEKTVLLTTFRRSGEAVATPVWVARDGDALVVTTGAGTGKVKRIRHTAAVELRPCTQRGKVAPDAPMAVGSATIVEPTASALAAIRAKYGLMFRAISLVERVTGRWRDSNRVVITITAR